MPLSTENEGAGLNGKWLRHDVISRNCEVCPEEIPAAKTNEQAMVMRGQVPKQRLARSRGAKPMG